jgi:nucleolar complex protein 3
VYRYRIRLPTEKEAAQKVSKETRKLRAFESSLLTSYQSYLQSLDALIQCMLQLIIYVSVCLTRVCVTASMSELRSGKLSGAALKETTVAVRALAALLVTHPHFNFRSNIIARLVPLADCRVDQVHGALHFLFVPIVTTGMCVCVCVCVCVSVCGE